MIKEYRKVATIKAEQFDGSDEMIKKYKIVVHDLAEDYGVSGEVAPTIAFELPTLEGSLAVDFDDWIATGVDGEHWAIADDIFKRTYVEVK